MHTDTSADCIIVGAGIIGLSHALAALRRGMRVLADHPRLYRCPNKGRHGFWAFAEDGGENRCQPRLV
jgi:glycine/D-amino acid oxidase-like deaminating enzyme